MDNMLNIILPYIVTVIGGYLVANIVRVVPSIISYIVSKVGIANYNKMKAISLDIFNAIEEDGRIGKLVNSKIDTFNDTIKRQFPNITDTEINILRQAISHEFNKDKTPVEKAIEDATATETLTDTNTPSTVASESTIPVTVNMDILNQIKDLMSKL